MSIEDYEALQRELSASQMWNRILFSLLIVVLFCIAICASYKPPVKPLKVNKSDTLILNK